MAKTGRKQKPHETSWGETIPGLAYQRNDRRWRVIGTNIRFTEADERLAVRKYQEQYSRAAAQLVQVPVLGSGQAQSNEEVNKILAYRAETVVDADGGSVTVRNAHPTAFWGWLRQLLLNESVYVAKMVGIPELAGLRHLPLPRPSIKLSEVISVYQRQNPSTPKAKQEALAPLKRLIEHARARRLRI